MVVMCALSAKPELLTHHKFTVQNAWRTTGHIPYGDADTASTMMTALSRVEKLSLLSLSLACVGIIANTLHGDGEPLIASIAFSGIALSLTFCLIRWLGPVFMGAGLKGRDMSKVRKVEMYVVLLCIVRVKLLLPTD